MEWWKKFRAWLEEKPSILLLVPAVVTAAIVLTQVAKIAELPPKLEHWILLNTIDPSGRLTNDNIVKLHISSGVTVSAFGTAVLAVAFSLVSVSYLTKYREAIASLRALSAAADDARKERETMQAAATAEREALRNNLQAMIEQERARFTTEQETERKRAAEQMQALQDFLDDTNKDAERIKDLLKKLNEHVIEVVEDSTTLTIEADGTAVVETTRRVQARGGPLYFLAVDAQGSQRLPSFRDIQFSASWVNAGPNERMAWLPVINGDLHKGVFIFFLPGVSSGSEAVYKYVYRWPGTFKPLIEGTDDFYEFTPVFRVPVTKLTFRIDKSIPKLSITHQGGGTHSTNGEPANELNYRVYRHTLHDLQALEKATFTLDKR